jgi:hypothetical protein
MDQRLDDAWPGNCTVRSRLSLWGLHDLRIGKPFAGRVNAGGTGGKTLVNCLGGAESAVGRIALLIADIGAKTNGPPPDGPLPILCLAYMAGM